MASTTSSVSAGDTASLICSSSSIRSSSTWNRPAVSTIAHDAPISAARLTPSPATFTAGLFEPPA